MLCAALRAALSCCARAACLARLRVNSGCAFYRGRGARFCARSTQRRKARHTARVTRQVVARIGLGAARSSIDQGPSCGVASQTDWLDSRARDRPAKVFRYGRRRRDSPRGVRCFQWRAAARKRRLLLRRVNKYTQMASDATITVDLGAVVLFSKRPKNTPSRLAEPPRHSRTSLTARQNTPAIDAAIYRPDSTLYQLQPSFHPQSTEPEPTARARRAGEEFY